MGKAARPSRMNRTGLTIALAIAAVVGLVFAVYPELDIAISALFFDPQTKVFVIRVQPWVIHARDAARWMSALIVAPAFLAITGKIALPRARMLVEGRAALLMIVTLALGPGLIANTLLKDHWGRPRPVDITQFGGVETFVPWWDTRGACPNNCSFIAGEVAGAFWTLAPAALAPPQWRPLAYAGALIFGIAVGVLRVGSGGHFFTDAVFSGVIMFLVAWAAYGVIYRWRPTRIPAGAVERLLGHAGERIRGAFAGLLRLFRGQSGKPS